MTSYPRAGGGGVLRVGKLYHSCLCLTRKRRLRGVKKAEGRRICPPNGMILPITWGTDSYCASGSGVIVSGGGFSRAVGGPSSQ